MTGIRYTLPGFGSQGGVTQEELDDAIAGVTDYVNDQITIVDQQIADLTAAVTPSPNEHIYYVSTTSKGNDANDGLTWGTPFATISHARTVLANNVGTIILGTGTHHITVADGSGNGLTFSQLGQRLIGQGPSATVVSIDVNTTFGLCITKADNMFANMEVRVGVGHTVTYLVGINTAGSASNTVMANMRIQPVAGTAVHCIGISPLNHLDVSETKIYNTLATGPSGSTVVIGDGVSSNVLNTSFYGCSFTSGTYDIEAGGANFAMFGGSLGHASIADVWMGSPSSGPTILSGVRSETSNRFLTTVGPTGGQGAVTISACAFAANAANADGEWIQWYQSGNLTIDGFKITSVTGVSFKVAVNSPSAYATVTLNNVTAPASVFSVISAFAGTKVVQNIRNYHQIDATTAASIVAWSTPNANLLSSGEEAMDRYSGITDTGLSATSGDILLTYFTAQKTEVINSVSVWTGATAAAATPSLIRIGLYEEAENGDLTNIAATVNDTTLLAATNTKYTKAFSGPITKQQGHRYAVALIIVSATTMPSTMGKSFGNAAVLDSIYNSSRRVIGRIAGQANLGASYTSASVTGTRRNFYAELIP